MRLTDLFLIVLGLLTLSLLAHLVGIIRDIVNHWGRE